MACARSGALSLHDALPIYFAGADDERLEEDELFSPAQVLQQVWEHRLAAGKIFHRGILPGRPGAVFGDIAADRKSTRLNSSHVSISYAVFCLKKKNLLTRA